MLQTLEQILYTKLFWITAVIVGIYAYLKFVVFNYWKRKGVPHEKPSILFGNTLLAVLGKKPLGDLVKDSYEKFKKLPFHGFYVLYKPILIINDPDLIRLILIKDFKKFRDRGLYNNEEVDPTTSSLFFLSGEQWKKLRASFSPVFTSGKLKQMFPLIKEVGDNLIEVCNKAVRDNNVVDLKDLMGRYTVDSIASVFFGIDCKSLENPTSEFTRYLHMAFNQNPIRFVVGAFAPEIMYTLRIPFLEQAIITFFSTLFTDVINERRRNLTTRKDFVDLLLQLLDKGHLEDDDKSTISNESDPNYEKLTMVQAKGSAFAFFAAGYETSSTTVTHCLYELALNPDIQEQVQEEIDELSNKAGELTYESLLNDYPYLHMVFCETMRKHTPVPNLNRLCVEDYDIPDSNLRVEKGTSIIIPVHGLHQDSTIYPNPERFDPYRWTKENMVARSPYVFLPFGLGNRNCIAGRLGTLTAKIALISVLANFKFSVCDKTPIPINNYSTGGFTRTPVEAVYLKIEPRKKKNPEYKKIG